ncbi:helix-turn-helix domain-containing protein [Anaerocolumna xylanovorans]|uniref:Helix-turn-helix domain-containing protein n=1 Tax=Anaerocolumna xylanovorans DSM 12503 TaxID=1121345 RepID=A0A1M7Y130_9FIRM|nr:helix-turn-helix domain-containing protein [Anaerocolumna xylanovorans]SHO45447.1 Helix-turn-helix domain-containing protein [Anaerocolumna xylanovorans DSM 12503]
MNFKELLLLAKSNEALAVKQLVEMYKPLLIRESIIDGVFDEDLYQELQLTLLRCVQKIKV